MPFIVVSALSAACSIFARADSNRGIRFCAAATIEPIDATEPRTGVSAVASAPDPVRSTFRKVDPVSDEPATTSASCRRTTSSGRRMTTRASTSLSSPSRPTVTSVTRPDTTPSTRTGASGARPDRSSPGPKVTV